MSHTPHDLHEEFPGLTQELHDLKLSDAHFSRIVEEYNEVNRAVHRAESLVEPISPEHETDLRKRRMILKDNIARMLAGFAARK